jgi:hypothetical protein
VRGVLVEEATTNLLTSNASLSIVNAAPYTTGTLNGTYTFSCGTGSITLSGGATGTVTPTAPQKKTISSATVTLTPFSTSTFNQIEQKNYNTSFTLGGTTRGATSLYLPGSIFNPTEGTIEFEFYINPAFSSSSITNPRLIDMTTDANNYFLVYRNPSGEYYSFSSKAGAGAATNANISTILATGWHQMSLSWKPGQKTIMIDGNTSTAVTDSSNLMPTSTTNIYLLDKSDSTRPANTQSRRWTFGKTWKTPSELSMRALQVQSGGEFTVDRNTSLAMPAKYDLQAHRIRA